LAEILKVSSTSNPSATAGALANTVREEGKAELQAIGPKAVNQSVKAITIARGYMAPSGVDLVFVPSFVDVEIDHENKTAMRMEVTTKLPFISQKARRESSQEEVDQSKEEEEEDIESKEEETLETREEERDEVQDEDDEDRDILDI